MSGPGSYGAHVAANDIRQHYLHFGSAGVPMIIVPGITSPAITWEFVAERLAEHFEVFVLDVRGRGLSSSGPGLDYGLNTLADDLIRFIQALGVTRAVLLGHSMGARIVARAMTRGATGVGTLVLVDPPVSGPGRRPYPSDLSWYVDSIRAASVGTDGNAMRAYCPTWSEAQLALRAEWLHTCFEPAIVAAYEGFQTDDIHSDFQKLKVPTLLLKAERGDVIRESDLEEIQMLNSAIAVKTVRDAGHMIPWDNLDGFIDAVRDIEPAP